MKTYHLLVDPELDQTEREIFLNKLDPAPLQVHEVGSVPWGNFTDADVILLWVSDEQGYQILKNLAGSGPALVFLPHPKLHLIARSFGVPASKETAFQQFIETEKISPVDILETQEKYCLNSLVIGDSLSILYDSLSPGFLGNIWSRFSRFFRLFREVHLRTFKITYQSGEEEKVLETSAMGILIVPHCESNLVFRRLIPSSGLDDRLIHVLLVSPKSLFSVIQFGLKQLFFTGKTSKIPDFLAYLASPSLRIESKHAIAYALDGQEQSGTRIDLKLTENQQRILTGFESKKSTAKSPKAINMQKLPTGSLREELTRKDLPWFRHATTEEFKELFVVLKQNAQPSGTFLVLMALSTVIATFGLFGNSSPVVIGAMILAPLMGPIISLAMGVLRQDGLLIKNSLVTIFWGVGLGVFFAVLITWVTPLTMLNSEILARIRPNLLDLGIAVASGIAGAYAHSREEIAKTLAGVAISVALVPPLAVAGIGLGWGKWNVFFGASLLFGTNLAGIVVAAAFTFLVLGFSPFRLAQKGLLYTLTILILITAPLALSFQNMVRENQLIQNLSGKTLSQGNIKRVEVVGLSPLRLSVTILSDGTLAEPDFKAVKQEIEGILGQKIELELDLSMLVE